MRPLQVLHKLGEPQEGSQTSMHDTDSVEQRQERCNAIGGRVIPECPNHVPGVQRRIDVRISLTSMTSRGDSRAIKLICCIEIISRVGLLGLWLKVK